MIPDTVVLLKAGCSSLENMIIKFQAGHVVRIENARLPDSYFMVSWLHKPRNRFKDCVKNLLKVIRLDVENWKMAENYTEWRRAIAECYEIYEVRNLGHAELKWGLRISVVNDLHANIGSWRCERRDRILLSKAEYVNHMESHQMQCHLHDKVILFAWFAEGMQIYGWIEEPNDSGQATDITARFDQSYEDTRVYLSSMCQGSQVWSATFVAIQERADRSRGEDVDGVDGDLLWRWNNKKIPLSLYLSIGFCNVFLITACVFNIN